MVRNLLLLIATFLLLPQLAVAQPATTHPAVKLVQSFYVKSYNQDRMPLSARLKRLLDAAVAHSKKLDSPVEGLDFSWTSNSQDADPGWEKTARFAVVPGPTGQTTVRVTFRNGGRDSEIRYLMVQEKGKWAVDDIRFVGGDNLQLSQMLTRGAQEKP